MKIGLVYPQTEFSSDPSAIQEYAQMAEGLGYQHILAYEHVLGASPDRPGGWRGPYTHQHAFMEPLVLFSFMAAHTRTLQFTTGVVILPQRQTILFAKQAATLDVLCGGRLRIGLGLGWNEVEYTALNENFHNRGKRSAEQVNVLRQLWTTSLVNFSGRWHTIQDAGLNPLPVQRPIPLWFGGQADAVLRRAAILGDGWMPSQRPVAETLPNLHRIQQYLAEAGRSPSSFGIEARIPYGSGDPDAWRATLQGWEAAGATHLSVNMMDHGFDTPAKHLAAMQTFAHAVGLAKS